MKKIKFTCSPCGAKLRVPTHLAGVSAPCPKCGAIVTAPSDITQAVEEHERGGRRKSSGSRKSASRASRSDGGSGATSTAVLTAPPAARLPEPFVPAAPPASPTVAVSLASPSPQVPPPAASVAKSNYAEPLPPLPVALPVPVLPTKLELPALEPMAEEAPEIEPTSEPEPSAQEDAEVYTSVALPPPNFGRKAPQPVPVESDSSTVFFTPPPPVAPAVEPEPEEIERAEAPIPLDDDVDIIVEEHFFEFTEPLPPAPTTQPVRVVTGLRDLMTPEFPSGESDLPRLDLSRAKLDNDRPSLPTASASAPASGRTKLVLPMPGSQVELTSPEDFLVRPTPPTPPTPPSAEAVPESLPEDPVFEATPQVPDDEPEAAPELSPIPKPLSESDPEPSPEAELEPLFDPEPSLEAEPEPLFDPEPPVEWVPEFLTGREGEIADEPEVDLAIEPEPEIEAEPEAELLGGLIPDLEAAEETVVDFALEPALEIPDEGAHLTEAFDEAEPGALPDLLANFGKDFIDEPFPSETLPDDALELISETDESLEWESMPELFLQVYPEVAQEDAELGLEAETEVEIESESPSEPEPDFDDPDFDPFIGAGFDGFIVSEPVLDLADIEPTPDLETNEEWFGEASKEVAPEGPAHHPERSSEEIDRAAGTQSDSAVVKRKAVVSPSWEIAAAAWEVAVPVAIEPVSSDFRGEPTEKKVIFEKLDSVEDFNRETNPFEPDAVIKIPVRPPVRRPMAPLQNVSQKREEAPAVAEFESLDETLAPVGDPVHEQPAEVGREESDPASSLEEMIFPPFEDAGTMSIPRSARPGLSRRQPVTAEAFGVPLSEGSIGRLFEESPEASGEGTDPSFDQPRQDGVVEPVGNPAPSAKSESERSSSPHSRRIGPEPRREQTTRGDVLEDHFDSSSDLRELVERRRKATIVLVTACATVAVSMVIGFIMLVDAFLGGFSPKEDYADVDPKPSDAPKVALPRIPTSSETADTATALLQDEPAMVDPVAQRRNDEPAGPVDPEAKKPTASSAFNQSIDAALGTKPAPASVIGSAALDWPTSGPGAAEKAAEEKLKAGAGEAGPAPEPASGFAPTPLKTAEAEPSGTAPRLARADGYNPPATFAAPGPGDSKLGKTHDVIDAFLRAPDVESRLRYTYHGESVRAAVEEYYKKWPFGQFGRFSLQLYQLETDTSVGGPYWVFIVSTSDADDGFPLIVRIEDGLLKVDWEIFAEFSDRHFLRFRDGKMATPANLRVIMERFSDYYGTDRAEFADLDKYYVYQAYPPYGDAAFTEFVFVEKDSEAGRELDKWIGLGSEPLAVIVTLDQKTFPHGKRHLVVTKWISDGWFR